MKQILIVTVFMSLNISAYSQQNISYEDNLSSQIQLIGANIRQLQADNISLKKEISDLKIMLTNAVSDIDSLTERAKINSNSIAQTAQELGLKISTTENNTNQKITEIDKSLSKNSLYGIIGVLSAILLSGLMYWLLRKKQKTDKTEVVEKLQKTQSSIEESLVKEFGKQTDLIEQQLQLLTQQKAAIPTNIDPDHSLALKLASEINLIERNINLMDKGTKGLKQLHRSVGKLKDNLSANGYEMPELLGKQYHQGMRVVIASSIPNEELEHGAEIITKVLIPQVNYKDKMIQTGQIEVSVGV